MNSISSHLNLRLVLLDFKILLRRLDSPLGQKQRLLRLQ